MGILRTLFGPREHILDDNHLGLLALFLKARPLDSPEWQERWATALKRPYEKVIKRFLKDDLLRPATLQERLSACAKVTELKAALREQGQKVSGRKDELVARLLEISPDQAERLAKGPDVYACSEQGIAKAQPYQDRIDQLRAQAEEAVLAAVGRLQYEEALKLVNGFLAILPTPMTWGGERPASLSAGARAIMAITSAPDVAVEDFPQLRLKAATDVLWGRRISGPKVFEDTLYTHFSVGMHQATLERYRKERDIIAAVQVISAKDACDECKKLHAKVFSLDDEAVLPNVHCTRGHCRCLYIAVVKGSPPAAHENEWLGG